MAFGFRPVMHRNGAPYNGAATKYYIADALNQALFVGDPVKLNGSGNTAGTYADITIATAAAGNELLGIIVGFEPKRSDLTVKHSAAATAGQEGFAWVADDPDLLFTVMEDADGENMVVGDIGNLGIAVAGTGDTSSGLSGWLLDSSDISSSTANAQYQALGIYNTPGNSLGATVGTSEAIWLVSINPNQHYFGTGQ